MAKRLLVGNWKMNPTSAEEARRILATYKRVASRLERTTLVACPPFVYASLAAPKKGLAKGATKVFAGAQDVFYEKEGAFTGEISPAMLRDLGLSYCIVGHSERRRPQAGGGDTDAVVAKKAVAALAAGLCPIVCVGEASRDGDGRYMEEIQRQIQESLAGVPQAAARKLAIAYEPVWAIGAKEAMRPEQVRETALFIRKVLADLFGRDEAMDVPVLYGGSVNWRNASDIIRVGEVRGLLIGRESVNIPGFVELAKAVDAA